MLLAQAMEIFLYCHLCQLEAQARQKPFVFLMCFLFTFPRRQKQKNHNLAEQQKHSAQCTLAWRAFISKFASDAKLVARPVWRRSSQACFGSSLPSRAGTLMNSKKQGAAACRLLLRAVFSKLIPV
jgi:hypothetical protein